DEFNRILPKLSAAKEYGFDTETKPSFKKGANHKVALLQLSTDDEAFLFRLNKIGLPDELIEILADTNKIKVGAAIRDDIKSLKAIKEYTQAGFVDLQVMVKELGFESFSLKKLSALVLGFRISKSQQLSNWEANELTPKQLTYAATDAWVSLKIYKGLLNNRR
ncbi:MAG: 3'-5' exonuclease domain-containing protein 2, partial [Bacteroidales bacterium]|nr:3'-5' exonuclease domain-containing protein 2 [Bacteroidales bacterium]